MSHFLFRMSITLFGHLFQTYTRIQTPWKLPLIPQGLKQIHLRFVNVKQHSKDEMELTPSVHQRPYSDIQHHRQSRNP